MSTRQKMMLIILVVLCGSACAAEDGLVSWWKFDDGGSEKTIESVSGKECKVRGNIKYVEGVSGTALRFDGFTTCVVQNVSDTRRPGASMTFEAWVAVMTSISVLMFLRVVERS